MSGWILCYCNCPWVFRNSETFPECFVPSGAGVCSWGACAGVSVHSTDIAALQWVWHLRTPTWVPCVLLTVQYLGAQILVCVPGRVWAHSSWLAGVHQLSWQSPTFSGLRVVVWPSEWFLILLDCVCRCCRTEPAGVGSFLFWLFDMQLGQKTA